MWALLAEIYGPKFTSQQPETPTDGWVLMLEDLSMADVGQGMLALRNNPPAWPPSAAEFRALCKPRSRENAAMYRTPPLLLTQQISDDDRAKGRAHIAAMKEGLCP